jgi:hypothetical protein
MAAVNSVRVVDRGALKLLRTLEKKGAIRVGVIGSEAAEKKLARSGATADFTVAQVAAKHEFGIGVPRRSWLRDYVDQNEAKIRKKLRKIADKVKKGEITLDAGLDALGADIVGEIQARISKSIPPPNSLRTRARKGSNTTLIDTGQFWSSITWAKDTEV